MGLSRATVQIASPVMRERLARVFTDVPKRMFRSVPAGTSGLKKCVYKYQEELTACDGPSEMGDCLRRLFAEASQNKHMWRAKELGCNSLPLEVACRAAALRHAQETQEPTSKFLENFSIVHVMQRVQERNFKLKTCWLNSMQLLWHSGLFLNGCTTQ